MQVKRVLVINEALKGTIHLNPIEQNCMFSAPTY